MHELYCWIALSCRLLRYAAYRLGIGKCPSIRERFPEAVVVVNRVMRWRRRLRIIGMEHCPQSGPAIFAGNHLKWDDPLCMYPPFYWGSDKNIEMYYMMRDDFFGNAPRLIDLNELVRLCGAYLISRESVKMAQLRPFMKLLREDKCFLMYPGRSRTRSGMFFEYRDGVEEPGSVSFFVAHAQHGRPEVKVPVFPITRTYNPVTKGTVLVVGEPLHLEPKAKRQAQREFDFRLMDRLGELVELNVPQIVCGLLYLRCLHGKTAPIPLGKLTTAVKKVLDAVKGRRIDPAAQTNHQGHVRRTLRYLEKQDTLHVSNKEAHLDAATILSAPELDTDYRRKNPVKHTFNHILHLKDVVAAIENTALGMGN